MARRTLNAIGIALCYLAVWQIAAAAVGKALILPSPADTVKALAALAATGEFYLSIGMTLLRVLVGFAAGVAFGSALGILSGFSNIADAFLTPLHSILKATPVASFIILVLLYLTSSLTPAFSAFVMVTPVVWANVRTGIRSTDPLLVEMTKAFRLSKMKRFMKLYVPGTMPQFVTACTTGLGFAWKSGVAAEIIANTDFSIGRGLLESKLYIETPDLFAWTAVVILLSVLMEKLMLRLLGRLNYDRA